jgi:hypothetical protein
MNCFAKTLAVTSLALAAGASGAHADILAMGVVKKAIVVTAVALNEQQVPLRDNGTNTITFRTVKANTPVVVSYNASCQVRAGDNAGSWGYILLRITIDDIEPHPRSPLSDGIYYHFCGGVEGAFSGAHSRQGGIVVPSAGTHTVRVYAARGGSAWEASLSFSSILIQN